MADGIVPGSADHDGIRCIGIFGNGLPAFAQGRFCTGEQLDNVIPLSMMRSRNFAKDYGVLMNDGPLAGVTARAVLVLDEDNKVVHSQLVGEIAEEPDYQAALAAL